MSWDSSRKVLIGVASVAVCTVLVLVLALTTSSSSKPNLLRSSGKTPADQGDNKLAIVGEDRFDEELDLFNSVQFDLPLAHGNNLLHMQAPEQILDQVEENNQPEDIPHDQAIPAIDPPKEPEEEGQRDEQPLNPEEDDFESRKEVQLESEENSGDSNNNAPEVEETKAVEVETEPRVSISGQGRVRGTTLRTRKGRDYFAFYNLPYARPPTRSHRFELPRPPKRWYSTRDATKPGSACMQKDKHAPGKATTGSEDCLYLNVYTPQLPKGEESPPSLPVMFYIHGGGDTGNGTRYSGKYMLDENVILVTLEFRIGAFGGFSTGTSEYPGNIGQKDQVMALKWVQKNIARFGGDPKRVLIFGNSSGSGDVYSHILSPMSAGLFSRAIMQSGTNIEKDEQLRNPKKVLSKFVSDVGCGKYENRTSRRLMDCLKNVNAKEIVFSQGQTDFWTYSAEPVPSSGDISNVFLSDYPWNLMDAGQVNKVPLIVGVNSEEMAILQSSFHTPNGTDALNKYWRELFTSYSKIPDDANHTVAERFYDFYFGNRSIDNSTRMEFVDFTSDPTVHASRVTGMVHTEVSGAPVFFYYLTKEPPRSNSAAAKKPFPPPHGAAHADEVQYLFLYDNWPEIGLDSPWFQFSERLIRMWVSFAATGRPISPTVEWPPINLTDNGMKWFQLDDTLSVVQPFTQRMELWDEYTAQLYDIDSPQGY